MQQAVEKILKFYLRDVCGEDETKRQFKSHDIAYLISKLKNFNVDFNIPQIVIDMSDTLTDWEAETRYGHSLVATRKEIETVLPVVEEMLNDVIKIEVELETKGQDNHDDHDDYE